MITAYHASNSKEIANNKFDLNMTGTAKNGDNQACGVHFSSARSIAEDYLVQSGCLVEATIPTNLPDFYNETDIDLYKQIMVQFIGEDRISELADHIEENSIGYSGINDLEDRIINALIIADYDLVEEIKDFYELDDWSKGELESILASSFELDESDCSHEKCYMMLSSILGDRKLASESLVRQGIKGFKYRWGDIDNHEDDQSNYCIMDVNSIRITNILPVQDQRPRRKM